mmetsp:Transcript_9828/g.24269  ORF Transcript_9828/g.24269 Transcript_9828/m.24269 type:complete len:290 (-) Transcript_9828:1157-2026(-)
MTGELERSFTSLTKGVMTPYWSSFFWSCSSRALSAGSVTPSSVVPDASASSPPTVGDSTTSSALASTSPLLPSTPTTTSAFPSSPLPPPPTAPARTSLGGPGGTSSASDGPTTSLVEVLKTPAALFPLASLLSCFSRSSSSKNILTPQPITNLSTGGSIPAHTGTSASCRFCAANCRRSDSSPLCFIPCLRGPAAWPPCSSSGRSMPWFFPTVVFSLSVATASAAANTSVLSLKLAPTACSGAMKRSSKCITELTGFFTRSLSFIAFNEAADVLPDLPRPVSSREYRWS